MRAFLLKPMWYISIVRAGSLEQGRKRVPQALAGRFQALNASKKYSTYKVFGLKALRVEAQ